MTSSRKIVLGLCLLAVPHFLYELRVSLISASTVLPPIEGEILPLAALRGAGLQSYLQFLTNLPFVVFSVFLFTAACLIGARFVTWGIRPEGLETKPWPESTADLCFAVAVGFHVTLLGSQTPWLRSGGHPAWTLAPGFLAAIGVYLAVKPPKESPQPLALPFLMLLGGLLSMPMIRQIADAHAGWHLASRLSMAADPGMSLLGPVTGRSLVLIAWTTGLILTLWRASVRDWKGAAIAAGLVVSSGAGSAMLSIHFQEIAGGITDRNIGDVLLHPPGSSTVVIFHDEDDSEKRLTPRLLPPVVWSTLLQAPVNPVDLVRLASSPTGGGTLRPFVTDILASSAVVNLMPGHIDEGLWRKCSELYRAAACERLLDRIAQGLRRPGYDRWLTELLDEEKYRLSEAAKLKIEAAINRQSETELSRIETRVIPAGANADSMVLFALTEGEMIPADTAETTIWVSFIEKNLVNRTWFRDKGPVAFEGVPPGRYLAGVAVRGNRQRYVLEAGQTMGPFEVGPGSVTLPEIALGVRAFAGTVGVPATGP